MAEVTFNTTAGQTIDRELLIAYLNTGRVLNARLGAVRHSRHRLQHGV